MTPRRRRLMERCCCESVGNAEGPSARAGQKKRDLAGAESRAARPGSQGPAPRPLMRDLTVMPKPAHSESARQQRRTLRSLNFRAGWRPRFKPTCAHWQRQGQHPRPSLPPARIGKPGHRPAGGCCFRADPRPTGSLLKAPCRWQCTGLMPPSLSSSPGPRRNEPGALAIAGIGAPSQRCAAASM